MGVSRNLARAGTKQNFGRWCLIHDCSILAELKTVRNPLLHNYSYLKVCVCVSVWLCDVQLAYRGLTNKKIYIYLEMVIVLVEWMCGCPVHGIHMSITIYTTNILWNSVVHVCKWNFYCRCALFCVAQKGESAIVYFSRGVWYSSVTSTTP